MRKRKRKSNRIKVKTDKEFSSNRFENLLSDFSIIPMLKGLRLRMVNGRFGHIKMDFLVMTFGPLDMDSGGFGQQMEEL